MTDDLQPQPTPSDDRSSRPAQPQFKRKRGRPRIEKPLSNGDAYFSMRQPTVRSESGGFVLQVSQNGWPHELGHLMSDMNNFENLLRRGLLIKLEEPKHE